jgi:hypothetical protein
MRSRRPNLCGACPKNRLPLDNSAIQRRCPTQVSGILPACAAQAEDVGSKRGMSTEQTADRHKNPRPFSERQKAHFSTQLGIANLIENMSELKGDFGFIGKMNTVVSDGLTMVFRPRHDGLSHGLEYPQKDPLFFQVLYL